MPLPKPEPGLIIGYGFLFREDEEAGRENVDRPHPCAVILVAEDAPGRRVSLLAISHSPPSPSQAGHHMKLRPAECRQMGLDSADHWINLRDINSFDWPGYDLAPISPDKSFVFGRMNKPTFTRLVEALKECAGRKVMSRD